MDRGFNANIRKSKMVIKFSQKDAILTPLHASADRRMCVHVRKFPMPVWPSDKSGKISKKLLKIAYQI